MNKTPIEWTTFSANPLKYRDAACNVVWGCVHASPGCQHCYSETLAKRYGRGGPFNVQTMNTLTPFLDETELHKMRTATVIGGVPVSGSRCFIGDMTDIFGEWVPDDLLNLLFSQTLEIRTDVTWQILTKRAKRMHDYLSWRWGEGRIPSRHIHIGVSVENQRFADERIPLLLQTPAAVRFISAEPLLEPLNICRWIEADWSPSLNWWKWSPVKPGPRIDWVICGGESGPGARPCRPHWLRQIVEPCKVSKTTAVFVKQFGSNIVTRNDDGWEGDTPRSWPMDTDYNENIHGFRDDYQGADVRVVLRDRKGGDPEEWPTDLRIRQFPEARA